MAVEWKICACVRSGAVIREDEIVVFKDRRGMDHSFVGCARIRAADRPRLHAQDRENVSIEIVWFGAQVSNFDIPA